MSGKLGAKLFKYFNKLDIENIAIESGFKQRESKLQPWMFLESIMFNLSSNKETCLNDISTDIYKQYGVEISKQGIDERFNKSTVKMVKSLLAKMIGTFSNQNNISSTFKNFNSVKIKDSTGFELPENMASVFPGNGGSSSKAQARIQYEFDLKNNNTLTMDIGSIKTNDYSDAWNIILPKIRTAQ